jgi:GNAT superfamily N-acetyltransferase
VSLDWIHETPPRWDAAKAAIVGGAPAGVFQLGPQVEGELLAGEWWRVEDGGVAVGYGWLDHTWGDAEILLAVAPEHQRRGVGSFILERLEQEAAARGLNYLHNVVRPSHPDRERVIRWLEQRRFRKHHDDDRLMRRVAPHPS